MAIDKKKSGSRSVAKNSRETGPSQTVERALRYIEGLMEDGSLRPGQRIIEADLVRELGMGRIPVREAIRILAGDGVIELLPNRGCRMRPLLPSDVLDMVSALTGVVATAVEVIVERGLDDAAQDDLVERTARIKERLLSQDLVLLLESLVEYQSALILFSGNRFLEEFRKHTHPQYYNRYLLSLFTFEDMRDSAEMYLSVTDAIFERNSEEARRLLRAAYIRFSNARAEREQKREGAGTRTTISAS